MDMMDTHYPTVDVPATPEYILSILQEICDLSHELDGYPQEDSKLTFQTTMDEIWGVIFPETSILWSEYASDMNRLWRTNCTNQEWKSVLASDSTLGELCRIVAERTTRPKILPAKLLGRECKTAGAFLTVRSMLRDAGADVGKIAPSTPLAEYTRRHPDVFMNILPRVTPGVIRNIEFRSSAVSPIIAVVILIGVIGTLVGLATGTLILKLTLCIACFAVIPLIIISQYVPYRSVKIDDLQTFRDLAVAMSR
jgi:hypothetical protein